MNQLRQLMLEELHRRNFAATTIRTYLHGVEHFNRHAVRSKIDLRMPHYAVLAVLEEAGPCNQKQVAECIALDKSDVTKLMNELDNRGLVQRVNDPDDRRRHRVTLTAKGKRQLEASDRELNSSMKMFLSGLSETEYQQLQRLLLKAIRAHDPRFGSNQRP